MPEHVETAELVELADDVGMLDEVSVLDTVLVLGGVAEEELLVEEMLVVLVASVDDGPVAVVVVEPLVELSVLFSFSEGDHVMKGSVSELSSSRAEAWAENHESSPSQLLLKSTKAEAVITDELLLEVVVEAVLVTEQPLTVEQVPCQ